MTRRIVAQTEVPGRHQNPVRHRQTWCMAFPVDVDWPWASRFWAGYGALFRDVRPTDVTEESTFFFQATKQWSRVAYTHSTFIFETLESISNRSFGPGKSEQRRRDLPRRMRVRRLALEV